MPPSAVSYDQQFLEGLVLDLAAIDEGISTELGLQILVAMCCASKRADLVPSLFQNALEKADRSKDSILELFDSFRETINMIWPFVCVPQVIPAALGLAGYLQSKGITTLDQNKNRNRPDFTQEDTELGKATRRSIYKASANNEVFEMLSTFYGDFAYALNTVGFGYNLGCTNDYKLPLPAAELIVTSALIALPATRQAGSHVKACIAFGYSDADITRVAKMAEKLAAWQGYNLTPINVMLLAQQARSNLKVA
ncbi:uncharacterized protein A1O9_02182 [Exophiala aquamarina CBS 119918]|uniref:Uncharacterized protein n=1 Tax=Exophiala aquamarina CBS 119918 TaxID=1182545 RepID=A0A072PL60_9EURO|nr:uncharacterized protein A1O9_02182 [Exophiala aquamarina CBS 119918]KEF60621.1 hypothetical protein A1O9_02182 [Exophiala aquamarina CBS 119918]